jgi:hypothetical protein
MLSVAQQLQMRAALLRDRAIESLHLVSAEFNLEVL